MFMDAGDSHLDVRYERRTGIENIRGHLGGQKIASINEKCISSDVIFSLNS